MPVPDIEKLDNLLHDAHAKWSAAANTVTRLKDEPRNRMLGVTIDRQALRDINSRPRIAALIVGLPAAVDWRDVNGRNHVSPVKDQGGCGSCVSFCTCATMESAVSIATGDLVDLSEADLHFCSAHGANCGGWWPSDAIAEAASRGVPLEELFPYSSAFVDGAPVCNLDAHRDDRLYRPTGSVELAEVNQRKQWLANRGPVCAVIHVYDDFFAYSTGVYRHVSGNHAGYHCIEVIGYSDAEQCWIAKNSWGTGWGDGGFFRIGYGECGIDETSTDRDPDGSVNRFPMYGIEGIQVPGGWRGFTLSGDNSAGLAGGVAAVSRIPGSMEVFFVGAGGEVRDSYWYDGGAWQGFELAPSGSASTTGGIAAVSRVPNSMEVFYVGPNGEVRDNYWYEGGYWQGFELAPAGSASPNGGVTAVSRIPNSMEVWWIGADGSVQGAYWYEGGQWGRYELAPAGSASTSSGISAVSRVPNSMELWWVGADGSLQAAYWYEGGEWARYQLADPGAASLEGAVSAVSRIPNSMELWWTGADGSIRDSFWYDGASWQTFTLAPAGSAPLGGAISAVSRIPESMELWWTGADGSLQDSYWYDGGSWQTFALAPAGSTSLTGGIASVSRIPNSMEVWSIGPNGTLQDNFWYP